MVERPKSFKTYEEQIDLLIERGMYVVDRERAIEKLRRVNYYRLSGYWYPFRMRKPGGDGRSDRFLPGEQPYPWDRLQPQDVMPRIDF